MRGTSSIAVELSFRVERPIKVETITRELGTVGNGQNKRDYQDFERGE
jgi:hypothetical protein